MNQHISPFEISGLITNSKIAWDTLLLIVVRPHQVDCIYIGAFAWLVCVSYQPMSSTTLSFEFPLPRCANSIEYLGNLCGPLSMTSLDARSGYHTKTFKIIPIRPKNVPDFMLKRYRL